MYDTIRVVYVVGSSHSGSTLLALLADQHPEIASVGETSVKPRIRREGRAASQLCSCGDTLARCGFWRAVFDAIAAQGIRFDAACWNNDYRFDSRGLDMLLTRETSRSALLRLRRMAFRHVPAYRSRVERIDRVNVAFMRAVLRQTRATVFFDATKLLTRLTYLLRLPELDVRVVRLVRDVRGIASSAKRRGASVDAAAVAWQKDQIAIGRVLESLGAERVHFVRYEQLCTQPRETLARLWEFCGVAPFESPAAVQAQEHHIIGNTMRLAHTIAIQLDESWRTRLTSDEQRRILHFAGAMNRAMGYA